MDGRKKSCVGDVQEDKTIINQIMLRFRPIAPRPVNSDGTAAGKSVLEKMNKKRVKRKYVRVKRRKSTRLVKDNDCGAWMDGAIAMAVGKELPDSSSEKQKPFWIDFSAISRETVETVTDLISRKDKELDLLHDSDRTAAVVLPETKVVVESWITMESVIDTCGDGSRLGCTDDERMRNLETDTCPGFISNSLDLVEWINPAYKKLVDPMGGDGGSSSEFMVSLVVREKFLLQWPAFSCRVRLVNNYCKEKAAAAEKKTVQMTVPCDVWKMDFGGFAWRLDIEAALCLGR